MPSPRVSTVSLAVLVLLGAGCVKPSPISITSAESPAPGFPEPPVLANMASAPGMVEVDLIAQPDRLSLLPSEHTDVWTYNSRLPGPTLDVVEGDRVVVHFTNNLGEPTNVHWHGLHVPSDQDGQPMDLVAPGGRRDYTFTIAEGSSGTYWYHPHPHGRTAAQVRAGLFGAIRVRPKRDPLPAYPETMLLLTDNRFSADGTLAPESHMDKMHGRQSDTFLGLHATLSVRAGEVRRMRIINASSARYHQLVLPGHTFLQVGTDGGLFETPVERPAISLAPAERAELLLRSTGQPGSRVTLESHPVETGMRMGASDPQALMTIAYGTERAPEAPPVPPVLRPVPPLVEAGAVARTLTLTDDTLKLDFRIDRNTYEHGRVDLRAELGATEVWRVDNKGEMDHPFHLHGFQFQVLDRGGVAEPFRAWKDTVNVAKGQAVRLIVKFGDLAGPRVYHCHILEHEDQGMMATLQMG